MNAETQANIARLRGQVEWWINTATTTPPRTDIGDVIALFNEYTAQAARLAAVERALVQALIPLEVLHAAERGGRALCQDVQDDIARAVEQGRAVVMAGRKPDGQ